MTCSGCKLGIVGGLMLFWLFGCIAGCDDSDSQDNLPDGDMETAELEQVDGDGDGDADLEAETEIDESGYPTYTCDTPWPIPTDVWQPTQTVTDEAYPQEIGLLVESGIPAGGVTALAAGGSQQDAEAIAATGEGLLRIAREGQVTSIADWPAVAYSALIRLDSGEFAATSGQTLYVGALDQAPRSTDLGAAISLLKASADGNLWVQLDPSQLSLVTAANGQISESYGPWTGFSISDLCEHDDSLTLATTNGLWRITKGGSSETNQLYTAEELPSPLVTGIRCVSENEFWLATQAGLVHATTSGLETLTGEQGLPVLELNGLTVDGEGRFLMPTDKGLVTYVPDSGFWNYYHSRYWVPDWEVRAAVDLGGNLLAIGTATGLGLVQRQDMTLQQKAEILDRGMYERHNRYGMFARCGLREPGNLDTAYTFDDDNDGQWTEMYLASQAFRYAVTGDAEAAAHAREAVQGMLRLLTVTGKKGFFARSVLEPERCADLADGPGEWHLSAEEQWCWKGDTSKDEYVGHVFGMSLFYDLVANEQEKAEIAQVFMDLHDGIIENGYSIVDIDGKVTEHGQLSPEFMELIGVFGDAGLNSATILGGLLATYHMTGEKRFMDAFHYLAYDEGYVDYVRRIEEINLLTHVNHDSEEMSFLGLATLIRYETDPCLMAAWQEGLEYLWEVQRPEKNPEFNMLYAWMSRKDENDLQIGIQTLREFHTNGITWEVKNSHRADVVVRSKLDRHGKQQSEQVLPYNQKQFIRWAENPYTLDEDGNGGLERMLTPWLLPYWLGRYLGLIVQP